LVYAFDPSFFEDHSDFTLVRGWRTLADMGPCPLYETELNPQAAYLHVCTFCSESTRTQEPPKTGVDIFWEPVDRFRTLADATAPDRSYLDEKRDVNRSAASKFFRSVRRDPRFSNPTTLAGLAAAMLVMICLSAGYLAMRLMDKRSIFHSPALKGVPIALAIGTFLVVLAWAVKRQKHYSLPALLMLRLYPYSLEMAPLLEHAENDSRSQSIAKALKTLHDAMENPEEDEA
jgi:hypothetical protein